MFLRPEPTAPSCPTCVAEKPEKPEEPTPQEASEPTEQQKAEGPFLDISRFKTQLDDGQKYSISFPSTELHSAKASFEKNDNDEWLIISRNADGTKEQILDLSSEPAQIFIGAFGQDDGGTTPLFVLQDGTVEYFRLYDGKGEKNTEFTVQKFKNLKNIIRLQQVYSYNSNLVGGGYTVIAEDKDGYYYDLVYEFEF
ncbi:hypothetical protein IKG45_01800 [Candidatus Saccharibacteria bacterium]|nr:hypothetical protein [Candidatus Saccharibacteria bacterium]